MQATLWHTERIMPKVKLLTTLIPFVKRKINNPSKRHDRWVLKIKVRGKFITQAPQYRVNNRARISAKEHCIAINCTSFLLNVNQFLITQEFRNWRFCFAVLIRNVCQATSAFTLSDIGEIVNLLTAQTCAIFYANSLNAFRVFKHTKLSLRERVRQFYQFHTKSQIRLVRTVSFHGVAIRNSRN